MRVLYSFFLVILGNFEVLALPESHTVCYLVVIAYIYCQDIDFLNREDVVEMFVDEVPGKETALTTLNRDVDFSRVEGVGVGVHGAGDGYGGRAGVEFAMEFPYIDI